MVRNALFDRMPIQAGDIVHCLAWERNGKYFHMTNSFKVFSFEPADGAGSAPKKQGSSLDAVEDGDLPDDFPA
jgi:hypothetical protein